VKRFRRIAPFLLGLGPALLFLPGIIRGDVLYWGTSMLQFAPWRDLAFDLLRSGDIPLWNPYSGMGAPLLANYQSAILYPPHWLYFLVPAGWAGAVQVLIHLLFAAWGMFALGRCLRMSSPARVVSAAAFSMSGYLIARASFLSIIVTAAWLPWIIVCAEHLVASWAGEGGKKRRVAVLLLGGALGMQWLAGHAQTAWYSALLLTSWLVLRIWRLPTWVARRHVLTGALCSAFLAFLLAAAQLFPTLEYMLQSARSTGVDEALARTYSLWPWRLAGLFAPDLFGNPARGGYWGYANYYEDALYVGVLPLLLALQTMRIGWLHEDESRSEIRFLSLISMVSILLALGWNTPVFPFLYRHVVTFNLFQAPTRWTLLLVFSLAVLAGYGFDRWNTPDGKALYWTRLGTAGAGIIGAAAYLGYRLVGDVQSSFVSAFALLGLWLCLAGLLSLTKEDHQPGWWLGCVVAVLIADLAFAGRGLNPMTPSSVFQNTTELTDQLDDGHRVYMPAEIEYHLIYETYFRFDRFASLGALDPIRESWLPNTNLFDRAPMVNNFDPLLPARYVTWMDALEKETGVGEATMLALMDVGWRAVDDPGEASGVRYERVQDAERVRFVPEAVAVESGDDALASLLDSSFESDVVAVLEGFEGASTPRGGEGSARIVPEDSTHQVVVEVVSDAGGWLVLSDLNYPGWQAYIDEQPTVSYTGNYLFRALWVPAGSHDVQFRYESKVFRNGVAMSMLGILGLLGLGIRWRRE